MFLFRSLQIPFANMQQVGEDDQDHNNLADLINRHKLHSLVCAEDKTIKRISAKCEKVKAIAKSEITLSIANDELKDDGISMIYDVVGARLKSMSLEESDPEYRQPTVQEWRTITKVHSSVRGAKKNDHSAYDRLVQMRNQRKKTWNRSNK